MVSWRERQGGLQRVVGWFVVYCGDWSVLLSRINECLLDVLMNRGLRERDGGKSEGGLIEMGEEERR